MKKALIFGTLIAAIGLVGPTLIGSVVNEKMDDFVGTLNESPGYEATIVRSQSSWFSTVATVKVGLNPAVFGDLSANPEAVGTSLKICQAMHTLRHSMGPYWPSQRCRLWAYWH